MLNAKQPSLNNPPCVNALSRVAVLAMTLMAALPASAQNVYTCSGVPRGVALDSNGEVLLEQLGSLQWPRLCSIGTTANGYGAPACKGAYAALLAAQNAGRSVTLWGSNPAGSCASNTPWTYVQGFYFFRVDN